MKGEGGEGRSEVSRAKTDLYYEEEDKQQHSQRALPCKSGSVAADRVVAGGGKLDERCSVCG